MRQCQKICLQQQHCHILLEKQINVLSIQHTKFYFYHTMVHLLKSSPLKLSFFKLHHSISTCADLKTTKRKIPENQSLTPLYQLVQEITFHHVDQLNSSLKGQLKNSFVGAQIQPQVQRPEYLPASRKINTFFDIITSFLKPPQSSLAILNFLLFLILLHSFLTQGLL